MFSLLRGVGV